MGDVGGIVGGYYSYKAGEEAADAIKEASAAAIALQREMWETAREDIKPWMTAGEGALKSLEALITAGPGEFDPEEDPGYKFGYEEFVEKPTLSLAAARGSLKSGKTEKALTRYASDYASGKYDNFLNRYYNKLRPYQSMAGLGQTAAGQSAAITGATGSGIAQNYLTGAVNAANARLAGASGLATGLSEAGQGVWDYYKDYGGGGGSSGGNYLYGGGGGSSYSDLVNTYGGVGR